jgi:hypothetical protein
MRGSDADNLLVSKWDPFHRINMAEFGKYHRATNPPSSMPTLDSPIRRA